MCHGLWPVDVSRYVLEAALLVHTCAGGNGRNAQRVAKGEQCSRGNYDLIRLLYGATTYLTSLA